MERYPIEEIAELLDAGAALLQKRLDSMVESEDDPRFLFVNAWILRDALAPSNIRHQRRIGQLSVEVGVARQQLGVPPCKADAAVILKAAESGFDAAVDALLRRRRKGPFSSKSAMPGP
jgi:hypothetical protein